VIALIDYGMGNRRSVEKAFEHVGARARFTSDQRDIRAADGLVVPGVGAFPPAMARLRELGLDELVRERAAAGAPVLGICLGFQLLYTRSEEHQDVEGIGLLSGTVTRLAAPGLKIPHIGWNEVTLERPSALTEGFGATASFYHVHSYAARPDDDADVVGRGEYGERFVSIAERGTIMGAQFHPEKSSRNGLALLRNFTRVCDRVAA
jgi:imidazole glycerol-phosphate synthase subunit HisH